MSSKKYIKLKHLTNLPRLPLEGNIDLTFRCNNNCRHCWIGIPQGSPEEQNELSFDEIRRIAGEARKLGCRKWSISGGEPMLRSDFYEIFDFLTNNSTSYTINTNGTLITPKIAKLMKKKGVKLVALYGATAEVHDHITRNPGSFEATMRGFAYLKEAGTGFIVQLIPMKDNYHQFDEMVKLAESLNQNWRVGAAWLYLSASGDPQINREIKRQRLAPEEVVKIDQPSLSYEEWSERERDQDSCTSAKKNCLFASCIATRKSFYVNPYGNMNFCHFIKDPNLQYSLRKGSLKDGWEKFIPSLADKVKGEEEYLKNCGSCEKRKDCRWCPVYGYLEHRRFPAKVEYLCTVADEKIKFKEDWKNNHRRFFKIADLTIQIDSDLPFSDSTFMPKFKRFEANGPGDDNIKIEQHFSLIDIKGKDLGKKVYRKTPWAIHKKDNSWIYLGISADPEDKRLHRIAVFNQDHTRVKIYNDKAREKYFKEGNIGSLTLFASDQILLARVLANRQGCYLHSSGVVLDGKGLLFAGHSEAGKSTMIKMLLDKAEILCDDRMIIRKLSQGYKIYGTWSHGEMPQVSPNSAPLQAILFLEKSEENHLSLLEDRNEIAKRLLACLIKPLECADWWDKMFSLVENMAGEIPCYTLRFNKSGQVVNLLKSL